MSLADPLPSPGVIKETARGVLSSTPVMGALRAVTSSRHISFARRQRIYFRLGKPVRPRRADLTFAHHLPAGPTLHLHYAGTIRQLYWLGDYEPDALPWFAAYAARSDAVVDVGAAEGVYSLVAAGVATDAVVVACEPGDLQGERLRANLDLNAEVVGDRIVVCDVALSDHRGKDAFFQLPGGTSSLNPEFRSGSPSRTVVVDRGDAVLPGLLGDRSLDLVKIDTESTEPAVIDGMRSLIGEHRPVIVCEVLAGRTEDALQRLVDDLGYRTWWLGPDGPVRREQIAGDPSARFVNWLLLPNDAPPLPPLLLQNLR